MGLLFLLPALPEIYKLNCCYPIPKQSFPHAIEKMTTYLTSQPPALFTDLMYSSCGFLFPLTQSLLFFHTPPLFLCSFFYFPPSVCPLLHYFLHSGLHPSPSLFLIFSPFHVFLTWKYIHIYLYISQFSVLCSQAVELANISSLVQLPSATLSLESEWEPILHP